MLSSMAAASTVTKGIGINMCVSRVALLCEKVCLQYYGFHVPRRFEPEVTKQTNTAHCKSAKLGRGKLFI